MHHALHYALDFPVPVDRQNKVKNKSLKAMFTKQEIVKNGANLTIN